MLKSLGRNADGINGSNRLPDALSALWQAFLTPRPTTAVSFCSAKTNPPIFLARTFSNGLAFAEILTSLSFYAS